MSYKNRLGTNQECNLCGESCLVGKINYAEGNGIICLIQKLRWKLTTLYSGRQKFAERIRSFLNS